MRRLPLLIVAILACTPKATTPPGENVIPDSGIETFDAGQLTDPDAGELDAGPPGGGDWAQYRNGPSGTWASAGTFTEAQARQTELLWTADAGEYGFTEPVIVGDSVYVTTGFVGRVLALDAQTGATKWDRNLDYVFTDPCQTQTARPGFWAAPAYVDGVLYAASPDGNVYALNPVNGSTLRQSPVASAPELIQSSPAASSSLGKLYIGVGSLFTCHHIPGRVISVDLNTGASASVTLTDGGISGSSVWSSVAIDEPTRRIYVTTGDPTGHPLDTEPYAQSILAMNADTLEIVDHWQNTGPGPSDNSDFGASPTLFTAADGTRLVGAPNKDGFLYVLDRDHLSNGPLWKYQLARGGSDPLSGQGSLVAPTFANGTLYAGGGNTVDGQPGSVVALDPLTGAVKWRHITPGFVFAGMPIVGEVIAVSSIAQDNTHSWLELISAKDGSLLKQFAAEGPTYSAPTIGHSLVLRYTYPGLIQAFRIP